MPSGRKALRAAPLNLVVLFNRGGKHIFRGNEKERLAIKANGRRVTAHNS